MNGSNRKDRSVCPICGEGTLETRQGANQVEYRGHSEELVSLYSVCDECGSEITTTQQATANKRAMIALRKRMDGFLSGEDIRKFREQFEITQEVAATLLGGGKVAFSRYENDDVVQSMAMNTLIRLCRASPLNLLILAQMHEVELPVDTVHKIHGNNRDRLMFLAREIKQSLDARQSVRRSATAVVYKVSEEGENQPRSTLSLSEYSVWGSA